jgi:hypothetical protein
VELLPELLELGYGFLYVVHTPMMPHLC